MLKVSCVESKLNKIFINRIILHSIHTTMFSKLFELLLLPPGTIVHKAFCLQMGISERKRILGTNIKRLTFLPLHILLSFTFRKISPAAGCTSYERKVVRKSSSYMKLRLYKYYLRAQRCITMVVKIQGHKLNVLSYVPLIL